MKWTVNQRVRSHRDDGWVGPPFVIGCGVTAANESDAIQASLVLLQRGFEKYGRKVTLKAVELVSVTKGWWSDGFEERMSALAAKTAQKLRNDGVPEHRIKAFEEGCKSKRGGVAEW